MARATGRTPGRSVMRSTGSTRGGAVRWRGESPPIRNYDRMSVSQIMDKVQAMPAAEKRKVRSYEEQHKNRKGVLDVLGTSRAPARRTGMAAPTRTTTGRSRSTMTTRTVPRATGARSTSTKRAGSGTRSSRAGTGRGTTARGRTTAARGRSSMGRGTSRSREASSGRSRGGAAKRTTNHRTIQRWIEERGGIPVSVRGTARGDAAGVLRVDFPGRGVGEEKLRKIDWDDFFDKFDEKDLAFLYQDKTASGNTSRFFRFVSRDDGGARSRR